jgi:hypothetical protein
MKTYDKRLLQNILDRYNPEYDLPDGSPVPWYTARLAEAVLKLNKEVKELREELKNANAK